MTQSHRSGGERSTLAKRARDLPFGHTFQGLFVYNILFEDSEVDETILELGERSRVLAISGAGCGVAAMMARHPESIDAIDLNGHHLALAALKAEAPRRLQRHGTFYDLLGRGWHAEPRPLLARVTASLPTWIREHWHARHEVFSRGLYGFGIADRGEREGVLLDAWARGLLFEHLVLGAQFLHFVRDLATGSDALSSLSLIVGARVIDQLRVYLAVDGRFADTLARTASPAWERWDVRLVVEADVVARFLGAL